MGIRITNRDLEVMLAIARNGFISIKQIEKRWFPSYWSCIQRLRKLSKYGYIEPKYLERNGSGIYRLRKKGLDYINSYYGYNYKSYSLSSKTMHFVSCAEFYVNFPHEILDYQIEYDLGDIIPDIYVKYTSGGTESDLFVEIDNSKLTRIIKSKIKMYNNYYNKRTWTESFDKFPKRLIVTDNTKAKKDSKSKIPFMFMTFKELKGGELKCLL